MVVSSSTKELISWSLTLLIPLLAALLLPVSPPSRRTRRWLLLAQAVGLTLIAIGLFVSVVMFPLVLLVMFCEIFSRLVQILTTFTSGFRCPGLAIASDAAVLVQPGVALLLFSTARKWRLPR
ncbi:MAG: hypothetical protein ACKOOC_07630 [Cyanobium sp.]